jgi:hypothetical protein
MSSHNITNTGSGMVAGLLMQPSLLLPWVALAFI